jgi:vacuolar iron transporter family protein
MTNLSKYSFGATSAIITCLAFIIGLSKSSHPQMGIIASLLVIAIADNISDSLGIHIYQESDLKKTNIIRTSTFYNFFTRFFVILIFILFIVLFPLNYAIIFSIIWGIALLAVMSYYISKEQKINPYKAILEHVTIAVVVILFSNFVSEWILTYFSTI